jgi:hypothetical protein
MLGDSTMKISKHFYILGILILSTIIIAACDSYDERNLANRTNDSNRTGINATIGNDSGSNITRNDTEIIFCAQDVRTCENGTQVPRDPAKNCSFSCEEGRSYISNDTDTCAVLNFRCDTNERPFFDPNGCGCEIASEDDFNDLNNGAAGGTRETGYNLTIIECSQNRPQACTREFEPVCGQVNVQCVREPCPPINLTFDNACQACANTLTSNYTEGACDIDT